MKKKNLSFCSSEEFYEALYAAIKAAEHFSGPKWYLNPEQACSARIPKAWSCGGSRGMKFPRANYWPNYELPIGPDYAPLLVGGKI